ncbi:LysM peptidoglycan-binding domain-containing protein [Euzebya sp.]|uniref:LysM peptidoglycan-binding domain-containing protein n=1 Tax=Euzebya sp. TaxID=1971409 RepID=UPI0035190110
MDFDYEGAEDFGGRILWGRIAVFAAALILAFILGSCTGGGGGVDQAELDAVESELTTTRSELESRTTTIAQLQQQLQEARNSAAPTGGGTEGTGGQTTDGGTEGPGTTPADTQTDDSGNRIYTVQSGDTLSTIAEAVYGDPTAFGVIASANNLGGSSPLQVGQELIIPENPDSGQ